MLAHLVGGHLSPCSAQAAMRLLVEVIQNLHVVAVGGGGVLFALQASPQLADELAALGAEREDDEDDGLAEHDARRSARLIESLLAPAERQGNPVPAWSPPLGTRKRNTVPAPA